MSPRHHPSLEILADYASGLLAPGFGLVTGAHLEQCGECRAQVAALEAASGAALAALPEAPVAPDALPRIMARLDGPAAAAPAPDRRSFLERLPLKRQRWSAPGIWVAAVETPHAPQDRVYIVSSAPRVRSALHGHSGIEFCTVLRGGFRDGRQTYWAGDFAATDANVTHRPIAIGQERCVCLFATEGRLEPRDWIGRIAFKLGNV
jgi:putative transcriptional regulator